MSGRPKVPVQHRFWGLNKRAFPYAGAVIAIFLLWTVLPHINDGVSFDDQVQAGDQMALTDSIRFTPAVGWEVETGFRVENGVDSQKFGRVTLDSQGVTLYVIPGDFDGTPTELLKQVDKVTSLTSRDEGFNFSDKRTTLTTDAGDVGVAEAFASPRVQGVIAALVLDGTGVEIQVVGPPDQMSALSDEVTAMVESIRRSDS